MYEGGIAVSVMSIHLHYTMTYSLANNNFFPALLTSWWFSFLPCQYHTRDTQGAVVQQSALKCCLLPFGAHISQPAQDHRQTFPNLLYFGGCRQKLDSKVHFSKPTDNLKLYLSFGAISFWSQRCAYALFWLVRVGKSSQVKCIYIAHFIRQGKTSWSGLQYLFWSSQIWLRWPHLSKKHFLVAMNTTGNCPEFALKIYCAIYCHQPGGPIVCRSTTVPSTSRYESQAGNKRVGWIWFDMSRTYLWKCLLLTFYPGNWAAM